MGFLKLERDAPLNLNKACFSCFVYIPSSVSAAVLSRDGTGNLSGSAGTQVMDHAISLITFGGQQESIMYDQFFGVLGECPSGTEPPTFPVFGGYINGDHPVNVQPSCIGVGFYNAGFLLGKPYLYVNIQGSVPPNLTGWQESVGPGFNCLVEFPGYEITDRNDESYFDETKQNAALGNAAAARIESESGRPLLQLDAWQHIIVSWQLNNESAAATEDGMASLGVTATSRLYCAVNDVNINGPDLPAGWPGQNFDEAFDPNAACSEATYVVGDTIANDDYNPSMSLGWGTIPTDPVWIPGPPTLAINDDRGSSIVPNLGIIMSHLQLFSAVLLDTSVEANRRLFLASDGKPADPKAAQNALGKKPAIQFIKSKDWIDGKNKGSAGNFTKVGTLANYTPGPGA